MKIHLIQQSIIGRKSISLRAGDLAKACFAVMLGCSLCSQVQAQISSSASNKVGGMFSHGDQSYRVVNAADYTSSTDISQAAANTVAQAGCFLDRSGCGSHCDSACSSCGGYGGDMGGFGGTCSSCGNYGGTASGYGSASGCPSCDAYWYGSIEALDMKRTGSRRFSNSPSFFLSEFDYQWAPRVTIGAVPDCVQAVCLWPLEIYACPTGPGGRRP